MQNIEQQNVKQRVALTSIAASAGLTVAKGVVGLATGSLAILSEAAHSLLDLAATVMTYFAVRISGKPADEEHHYGHGKVESVTALAETALLFLLSGIVIWEAAAAPVRRPSPRGRSDGLGVRSHRRFDRRRLLSRARALPGGMPRPRARRSKRMRSISAPTCGPRRQCWSASERSRSAIRGRIRRLRSWSRCSSASPAGGSAAAPSIPSPTLRRRGRPRRSSASSEALRASSAIEQVRVRQAGPVLFVDLTVAVSRTLPLDRVAAIRERIANAIRAYSPKAEVTVNIEPRALDDETVLERVMVIARNRALAVHHVTVHAIEGRLAVALDLEVDGTLRARRRARDRQRARRRDPRRTGAAGRSRDAYRAACSRSTSRAATPRPSVSPRCATR